MEEEIICNKYYQKVLNIVVKKSATKESSFLNGSASKASSPPPPPPPKSLMAVGIFQLKKIVNGNAIEKIFFCNFPKASGIN